MLSNLKQIVNVIYKAIKKIIIYAYKLQNLLIKSSNPHFYQKFIIIGDCKSEQKGYHKLPCIQYMGA